MRRASGIKGRGNFWIAAAILVAIATGFLLTRDPETPTPNPPGTFSFAFEAHIVPKWEYW